MATKTKEKQVTYLTRMKAKSQVTIPAAIRKRLNLECGVLLETSTDGRKIVFEPKIVIDRDDDIDAAFAEGLKDIREGRTIGPFESVEEFKAFRKTKTYKDFLNE